MKKIALALALTGLLSSASYAGVESVEKTLKQQHPALHISNVAKTEMNGIYSAKLDGRVVYVNEDAQYMFVGSMVRLKDEKNLTWDLIVQQNSMDWNKLPLQDAIKTVKGNGSRKLAIFSDPNCPYCKQLDKELEKLDNVTIYTFIYPLKPYSVNVSKQVWCEKNQTVAWKNLMQKQIQPEATASCDNPIDRNLRLGQLLQLEGTPVIIFANGFKWVGAHSKEQIEEMIKDLGI